MNAKKIEEISINKLTDLILSSDRIEPYIDCNDKTPSWDGNLFLYKSSNTTNKNLLGRIPIQVKGKLVQKLPTYNYTFPIKIIDLHNYLNDGGVLYFVITMKNVTEYKIFYLSLLPFDINKILKSTKKNQKTISLSLKLLDINSAIPLNCICENFLIDKKLQYSTFQYSIDINKYNLYFSKFVAPNNINLENYLLNTNLYVYAQNSTIPVPIVIDKCEFSKLEKTLNFKVCIGTTKYYDNYLVITTKNENYIKIGKGIYINCHNFENECTLNYKNIGTLNEQLKDIEFLKDFYSKGNLCLNNIPVIKKLNISKQYIKNINIHYKKLSEIKSLLTFFNVKKDLEITKLDSKKLELLYLLIDVILYNKNIEFESCTIGCTNLNLANINILVYTYLTKENYLRIIDLFSLEGNQVFLFSDSYKNSKNKLNRFLCLKAEYMINQSNLDLDFIENSIKKSSIINNKTFDYVNLFALELIRCYDLNKNSNNFLYTALNLLTWTYQYSNSLIIYINICQTLKRLNILTPEHINKLIVLKKQYPTNDISFAINVLINSNLEAYYDFNNLSLKEQNTIKKFPIYKLYESIQNS